MIIPALAILSGFAAVFAWRAFAVAGTCDRMEATRRDLEGVEIEGGWLFDVVNPDPKHPHERSKQRDGKVGRVFGGQVHGKGL